MLLNLRSRLIFYHPVMNSLLLWDNRASKKLLAVTAANDPAKLHLIPYDNFNWVKHAWETSATHGSATHDQVSALLVILPVPAGSQPGLAKELSSVTNFARTSGTRHTLPPHQSLAEILPNREDQAQFSRNSTLHVTRILVDAEYYLPTYDQEQSSTRGNMLVMEHYPRDVLRMPPDYFEERFGFLLGDRLTTARARAAQDQRSLDRSEHRMDHLSSFALLSGAMHVCMNMITNIGKNSWGSSGKDCVSLSSLLDKLRNRDNINTRKIDFYAWLRFLDVVLRALVLKAAMTVLKLSSPDQLGQKMTGDGFMDLCSQITAQFVMPSLDRLEADGVKRVPGSTISGNAVLLTHNLMTLREMRHAIKHGHPERMERMLKYWAPMYYAGGGYNYANGLMELLHNLKHDWPAEISPILRAGMLMNTVGESSSFKETDLRSHVHGVNARPALLEKITPALGHICQDVGVDTENKHHAKVRQDQDVGLLLKHLCAEGIFNFAADQVSSHAVIDLYQSGVQRLAGSDGGHAKHLRRHVLRSRARHENLDSEQPYIYIEDEESRPTGAWAVRFHDDKDEVEFD
ncbi:hypothetical protein FB45DRAFT_981499 [Roridomyces roridus]|uniref:DUF6589 domain-containing protein n=1 Tax=Roridomyces roridus TaxID=1738132 RepID=A0AAD7BBR2_9AGAR|nr:hypothetical protein FB45DRAFT_981499 [Roridomyces roridus]